MADQDPRTEGLTFSATDGKLIDCYLRPKLADKPIHTDLAKFIHEVDLYSKNPEELLAGFAPATGTGDGDGRVWYLFTPVHCMKGRGARKARTVGPTGKERWHSEGGAKQVGDGGKVQHFSYKIKTPSGDVKPGWLMVEYSVDGERLALCKVYRSPRAPRLAASSSSNLTAAAVSGCKRKAEKDHPDAPASSVQRLTAEEEYEEKVRLMMESFERELPDFSKEDFRRAKEAQLVPLGGEAQPLPLSALEDYCYPEAPACSVLQQTAEEDDNFFESLARIMDGVSDEDFRRAKAPVCARMLGGEPPMPLCVV